MLAPRLPELMECSARVGLLGCPVPPSLELCSQGGIVGVSCPPFPGIVVTDWDCWGVLSPRTLTLCSQAQPLKSSLLNHNKAFSSTLYCWVPVCPWLLIPALSRNVLTPHKVGFNAAQDFETSDCSAMLRSLPCSTCACCSLHGHMAGNQQLALGMPGNELQTY